MEFKGWVFVLDEEGYDVRGGNAEVFTSLERAQAYCGVDVGWIQSSPTTWEQTHDEHSTAAIYIIEAKRIDPRP